MMNHKLMFAVVLIFVSTIAWGQSLTLTKGVEISANIGDYYQLINLKEKGVLLYLESEPSLDKSKKVLLAQYDTALQKKWENNFVLKANSYISKTAQDKNLFYFLISNGGTDYEIAKLDTDSGLLTFMKYEKIADIKISHFVAQNHILLFGGIANGVPMVVYDDYERGKLKILPIYRLKKKHIEQLAFCETDQSIFVLLTPDYYSRKKGFQCYVFDNQGDKVSEKVITNEVNLYPYTFQTHLVNKNEQYLVGLYSHGLKQTAQGVYLMHIVDNEIINQKFNDFSDFKNFIPNFQKEKEAQTSSKADKKQKLAKHNYLMTDKSLQVHGNQILFVGSTYEIAQATKKVVSSKVAPVASAANWSRGSGRGRVTYSNGMFFSNDNVYSTGNNTELAPQTVQNLNSKYYPSLSSGNMDFTYHYVQGIVCSLDKKGSLLWDNRIEHYNLFKFNDLNTPLQASVQSDATLLMFYPNGDKLYYKQGQADTFSSISKELSLNSQDTDKDSTAKNTSINAFPWYSNQILLYGIRRVSNIEGNQSSQKVFFIGKMDKEQLK